MAAFLLGSNPEVLATLDPTALSEFGHLLETFVVGEVRKQVSWMDAPPTLGHWRGGDDEVDLVVEFADGRILAFEVKASQRIAGRDRRGLANSGIWSVPVSSLAWPSVPVVEHTAQTKTAFT